MAITAVAQFNSSPLSTSDYQAQNAHINAFIQQMAGNILHISEWGTTTIPAIPQGLYLRHAGVLYIVDTSAYTIQTGDLSGSGTYYIRIKDDGAGAIDSIDWESSLTGFAWNYAYQGMYDSSGHQVLPYSVVYDGASAYTKYKWLNGNDSTALVDASGAVSGASLSITGAILGATVNTGQGANKVYSNTYNSISSSGSASYTETIPSMSIGETKYYNTERTSTSSANQLWKVNLPAGGTYYVLHMHGDYGGDVIVYADELSGGSTIIENEWDYVFTFKYDYMIRRVS